MDTELLLFLPPLSQPQSKAAKRVTAQASVLAGALGAQAAGLPLCVGGCNEPGGPLWRWAGPEHCFPIQTYRRKRAR